MKGRGMLSRDHASPWRGGVVPVQLAWENVVSANATAQSLIQSMIGKEVRALLPRDEEHK